MNFDDYFGQNFQDIFWGFGQQVFEKDPVIKQCEADATEYFRAYGIDLSSKQSRLRLNKEQKDRIVEFLKNRKAWYGENGYLLRKEEK